MSFTGRGSAAIAPADPACIAARQDRCSRLRKPLCRWGASVAAAAGRFEAPSPPVSKRLRIQGAFAGAGCWPWPMGVDHAASVGFRACPPSRRVAPMRPTPATMRTHEDGSGTEEAGEANEMARTPSPSVMPSAMLKFPRLKARLDPAPDEKGSGTAPGLVSTRKNSGLLMLVLNWIATVLPLESVPLSSMTTLLNEVVPRVTFAVDVSSAKLKLTGEELRAELSVSWKSYTAARTCCGRATAHMADRAVAIRRIFTLVI